MLVHEQLRGVAVALVTLIWAASAFPAAAAEIVVVQKGKAFSTANVKAKVGDKIVFRNEDSFAHNIFTLSPAQPFDLGITPKGGQKDVTLTKEGQLEIECAIHPAMKVVIDVTP
jgi:plastocyanin